MRYLVFCMALFVGLSSVTHGADRAQRLKQRGMMFDGWQDEGLLALQADLPKHDRMSTRDLHRLVDEKVAQQVNCQTRTVASVEGEDACLKTLVEW